MVVKFDQSATGFTLSDVQTKIKIRPLTFLDFCKALFIRFIFL